MILALGVVQSDHATARGGPRRHWCVRRAALLLGWRLAVLWEGGEVCHIQPTWLSCSYSLVAIPEICPPGEDGVMEVGKIFGETKQTRSVDESDPASGNTARWLVSLVVIRHCWGR